jgi:hypothetical protein
MARTPYATRTYDTPQKGPRVPNVTPSFIVIHHAATLDFDAVINLEMGAREVSSTVIIKDGQVASMFDEAYRAWSLSSQYWDSVSLSSETCNETTSPGWTISEASYQTLAKVVADWCVRYGIACNRTQILGHREVYTRYGASYATACPGGIDLDRVVRDAAAILAGGGSATNDQENDMNDYLCTKVSGNGLIGKDQRFVQGADGVLRCLTNGEWGVRAANYPNIKPASLTGDQIADIVSRVGLLEYVNDAKVPGGVGRLTGKIIYSPTEARTYPKVSVVS